MQTLNRILEDKIREVEQGSLSNNDLDHLERYAVNFTNRVRTYNLLRDRSEVIVLQSLQYLAETHPKLMENQAERCKYDMSNVLRYIALSILLDDELMFKEKIMDWLGTIICSYQVSTECSMVYQKMQAVIKERMPLECSLLVKPYIELTIATLQRD